MRKKVITKKRKTCSGFLISVLLLSGCAYIRHSDQLITLQAISDNQDKIQKYITQQEDNFMRLKKVLMQSAIAKGTSKQNIVELYGEPVLSKPRSQGDLKETLLYRLPTEYFNTERIYLYFDEKNLLTAWEIVPPN